MFGMIASPREGNGNLSEAIAGEVADCNRQAHLGLEIPGLGQERRWTLAPREGDHNYGGGAGEGAGCGER